jgi:glycerophosphoryl diester phosphodiesterase
VFDCPLAELASLTVGEPERLGDRFGDVLLPTLRQAVDLLNRTPYVTVFVELKRHSLSHFGVARAMAELLEAMAEARFPWVLISFVDEAVRHFQASARGSTGWVLRQYDAPSRTRAETLAPDYLIVKNSRIPHGIDRLWPGPWRWMVYDVDDAASALRCTEIGASLIETNQLESMMSLPAFSL